MASLNLNTFLRSSIARDPFSLGDIGPEDVLRIESEFPALFNGVENPISEIKKEESKCIREKNIPQKHDCSKKSIPQKAFTVTSSKRKVESTVPAQAGRNYVNKTPHVPIPTAPLRRKVDQKVSETETVSENGVRTGKDEAGLPLKELRSSLLDVIRRFEKDFPSERIKELRTADCKQNSIGNGNKIVEKHKSNVQLLHIKKVPVEKSRNGRQIITQKNPQANVQFPSKSLPNVIFSRNNNKGSDLKIGNSSPLKNYQRKKISAAESKNIPPFERNVPPQRQNQRGDAIAIGSPQSQRTSSTIATKPGPGFLRNANYNIQKSNRTGTGQRASQLLNQNQNHFQRKQGNDTDAVNELVNDKDNLVKSPQRKTETKKVVNKRVIPRKVQPKTTLPKSESDTLSSSLLENNPLKQKESSVLNVTQSTRQESDKPTQKNETAINLGQNSGQNGQIHIRKPPGSPQDHFKVQENIPKESVSRFEQLLLARTLASQYERQGRFHKHHTFSNPPKKPDKTEPELPDPTRNILPPNFLRDFKANTPSCKETLEKIAEELIYAEVLKYLDTEKEAKILKDEKRSKIENSIALQADSNSSSREDELQEPEQDKQKSKSRNVAEIRDNAACQIGLSTINEESEELVTPELTPPISLTNNYNETEQSTFLSPVTSEDEESTVLETPELTPIARNSIKSRSSSSSKLNKKEFIVHNQNQIQANINETTDCSELSEFLFTEGKTDVEISKSITLEELQLVTPILSDIIPAKNSLSIAEREFPHDSPNNTSRGIDMDTPKSSVSVPSDRDHILNDEKRFAERLPMPTRKKSSTNSTSEDQEESVDNNYKGNVTFKSPPVVEFRLPKKKKVQQKPTPSLSSSKVTKKSSSSFGDRYKDIMVSDSEESVSLAGTPSYNCTTGRTGTGTTMTENLSEGEFVGKRYKSPGELSAPFYPSPGMCPFSYTEMISSDDLEEGDALSEGVATMDLSLGEIVVASHPTP